MNSGPGWNLDWHSTKPPGVVPSSAEELIVSMFYCVHLIVLYWVVQHSGELFGFLNFHCIIHGTRHGRSGMCVFPLHIILIYKLPTLTIRGWINDDLTTTPLCMVRVTLREVQNSHLFCRPSAPPEFQICWRQTFWGKQDETRAWTKSSQRAFLQS